jgi:hypothetical protein
MLLPALAQARDRRFARILDRRPDRRRLRIRRRDRVHVLTQHTLDLGRALCHGAGHTLAASRGLVHDATEIDHAIARLPRGIGQRFVSRQIDATARRLRIAHQGIRRLEILIIERPRRSAGHAFASRGAENARRADTTDKRRADARGALVWRTLERMTDRLGCDGGGDHIWDDIAWTQGSCDGVQEGCIRPDRNRRRNRRWGNARAEQPRHAACELRSSRAHEHAGHELGNGASIAPRCGLRLRQRPCDIPLDRARHVGAARGRNRVVHAHQRVV